MIDLERSLFEQRHGQGFRGAVKTPVDILRYQRIIAAVQPAWIIETGTYNGCSATWLADESGAQVVTIDTHPQASPETRRHPNVTWITGGSTDSDVVAYVTRLVQGDHPIMVSLDSDHSADHVYAEMNAYGPLVTVGSYMVVEDGIVRWLPEQLVHYRNSSPLDAIERWLEQYPADWVVNEALEDMYATTQHPKGFLLRAG